MYRNNGSLCETYVSKCYALKSPNSLEAENELWKGWNNI
jgi:hypothetical protein